MAHILFIVVLLAQGWLAAAQSQVVVTYNNNPLDITEGITLSEVTYPRVKLELSGEGDMRTVYPYTEMTIVRKGRAVYSMRSTPSKDESAIALKPVLQHARSGDALVVRLRRDLNSQESKILSIPIN